MTPFLERYRHGEHEAVWAELVALGDRVRQGSVVNDARAVARETMTRSRQNIEMLVSRLDDIGYQFRASPVARYAPPKAINPFTKRPLAGPREPIREAMVFCPPGPETAGQIAELERMVGVLPLSVRAWYEVVGEVDLTGSHPRWKLMYLDPLVMPSLEKVLRAHRAIASAMKRKTVPPGKALISLPDSVMKDRESGAGYWIELPGAGADAPLEGWGELTTDVEKTYFVDYLRLCFRFGGFPGFARRTALRKRDRALLTSDLSPI